METLTQERLKKLLHYDPETGEFRWKVARGPYKVGAVANHHTYEGYIRIMIDYKPYNAHRLAFLYMEGYFPEHEVDHINRIRDDNRWENLRHVTRSCNAKNSSLYASNKSGVTGVCKRRDNRWESQITVEGNYHHIGNFTDFTEAVKERWKAEVKYNFPNCNTTSSAYLYLQKIGEL